MRVKYDLEADAIYIYFSDKKPTKTEEVREGLIVDFSEDKIVGLELLDVKKNTFASSLDDISISLSKTAKIA